MTKCTLYIYIRANPHQVAASAAALKFWRFGWRLGMERGVDFQASQRIPMDPDTWVDAAADAAARCGLTLNCGSKAYKGWWLLMCMCHVPWLPIWGPTHLCLSAKSVIIFLLVVRKRLWWKGSSCIYVTHESTKWSFKLLDFCVHSFEISAISVMIKICRLFVNTHYAMSRQALNLRKTRTETILVEA